MSAAFPSPIRTPFPSEMLGAQRTPSTNRLRQMVEEIKEQTIQETVTLISAFIIALDGAMTALTIKMMTSLVTDTATPPRTFDEIKAMYDVLVMEKAHDFVEAARYFTVDGPLWGICNVYRLRNFMSFLVANNQPEPDLDLD